MQVHNLGAVKQQLWGLDLEAPCAVGDEVVAEESAAGSRPLGRITSFVDTPSGSHRALAYLRCRQAGGAQADLAGSRVRVAGTTAGVVVPLPYLSRAFAPDQVPAAAEQAAAAPAAAAEQEAAQARREEKLKELQERLAAWQAQQPPQ